LQKRQKAGVNVTVELVTAKLDLLKAKGDLLTAVIDWHAASVKLRQAMGLLVRDEAEEVGPKKHRGHKRRRRTEE